MREYYESTFKNVRFWTGDMEVEQAALNQIRNMSNLPVIAGHLAIMPDVHMGMGATVGSVIPTKSAVIPAAVGVDIGCGMCALKMDMHGHELPDNLKSVRDQIERDVPVGFEFHQHYPKIDQGLASRRDVLLNSFKDLKIFQKIGKFDEARMANQLGTLGGGNHFIEICLDEKGQVWIMLHSGSRNVGKTVGEAATELAKQAISEQGVKMPDMDLAWLSAGSEDFDSYIAAMQWAQNYASLNRDIMMWLTLRAISKALGREMTAVDAAINCHHNYTTQENHGGGLLWITRKGAVNAAKDQLGIIPGSMGARSFIVRGRGNAESYCSCSHGAGRRMSRGEAKRKFTMADLAQQTSGVECRKDQGVVDEIPGVYKSIDDVMKAQEDLVSVEAVLKQVLCVKG